MIENWNYSKKIIITIFNFQIHFLFYYIYLKIKIINCKYYLIKYNYK